MNLDRTCYTSLSKLAEGTTRQSLLRLRWKEQRQCDTQVALGTSGCYNMKGEGANAERSFPRAGQLQGRHDPHIAPFSLRALMQRRHDQRVVPASTSEWVTVDVNTAHAFLV